MNDEMKIGQELLDEATLEEIRQLPTQTHSGKSIPLVMFGVPTRLFTELDDFPRVVRRWPPLKKADK